MLNFNQMVKTQKNSLASSSLILKYNFEQITKMNKNLAQI